MVDPMEWGASEVYPQTDKTNWEGAIFPKLESANRFAKEIAHLVEYVDDPMPGEKGWVVLWRP